MKRKRNFCSSSSGTRGDQQGAAFRIVSALGLLLGENGRRVAAYDHVARCLPYHQLPDVGLPQSGSFCHPAGVSLTQHHRRTGTPLLLYPQVTFRSVGKIGRKNGSDPRTSIREISFRFSFFSCKV